MGAFISELRSASVAAGRRRRRRHDRRRCGSGCHRRWRRQRHHQRRHGQRRLVGGGGADDLFGEDGEDVLADGDAEPATVGADTLDGGAGHDRVDYVTRGAAITVDLSSSDTDGGNSGAVGEGDDVDRVEDVTSGAGDDD